jgi:hypothetical protein
MKHLLLPLLLVASVMPVLAHDEGGDGAYIPDYQTLVREGYGPRHEVRIETYGLGYRMRPMPTQAYYANGYTVYYGYQPVPERAGIANSLYAFGYAADFYNKLIPGMESNLDRLAVTVSISGGDMVAKARTGNGNAVTTVQRTAPATAPTANPLPAIGEKPSH